MAMVLPGVEDFLTRFPEFLDVGEDRISATMEDAAQYVSDDWIEGHVPMAVMLLTAHFLFSETSLTTSIKSSVSGENTAGPITSKTIGPLSVKYGRSSSNNNGSSSGGGTSPLSAVKLDESPYGSRFIDLVRKSFPPVLVVI